MPLGDLFKSKQERERDQQRKRRKAFREAENAIDSVKERINKLKKERDKAWGEAREYLKNGQKAAAQRALQTCRASEMLVSKLDTKRWVFEQLISKMELAKNDQDFASALQGVYDVVQIDPEATADVLGAVQDKLGEQVDTDKIWERAHEKEMDGVETAMTDAVPSLEDMQKQLEDEVAVDIRQPRASKTRESDSSNEEPSVKERIGEGRRRLKDLLGEDK